MNKKVICALTAIALQSVFLQSAKALDADATYNTTIKITSNIVATPCEVDAGSQSASMSLGSNLASMFNTGSSAASYSEPLTITLINCPEATTLVNATFSGTASTFNKKYFKNTSTTPGDAGALDIDLMQRLSVGGDQDLQLSNGTVLKNIAVTNGTASFDLVGRMINTSNSTTIGAGNVSTAVTIDFAYK